MSDSQSGSSNKAKQVSTASALHLPGERPDRVAMTHRCWRFEQTPVCEVNDDGTLTWRHLFRCVECCKLQSLRTFC